MDMTDKECKGSTDYMNVISKYNEMIECDMLVERLALLRNSMIEDLYKVKKGKSFLGNIATGESAHGTPTLKTYLNNTFEW